MKKLFNAAWFRCISVLLCIALVSGGLLAVLNEALSVTAEERTMRAVKKIYGEEKTYSVVVDADDGDDAIICENFGSISKLFVIGDESTGEYDYLFKSTGNGGYKNGTVSLWIRVSVSGGERKIEKVILDGFTKQTLMSKLGGYYDEFSGEISDAFYSAEKEDGKIYAPVSGATKSATATTNAVNCVIFWLRGNA